MSFIEEQRKQILEENNTAQAEFLDILEHLSPTATTIDVRTPLSGDIDCDILEKCSFTGITAIQFAPGNITSIKNIPPGVTKVICAENILVDVPELPASVVELDVQKNAIRRGDAWSRDLKELVLSENHIASLENLPAGLEVLRVENCHMKVLRLEGLDQLRILHCSGNPGLVIENVPESLQDFQSDNDALTEIGKLREEEEGKGAEKRADYQESLHEYFEMKHAYQERVLKMKHEIFRNSKTKKEAKMKIATLKPKCVKCDRGVGTIFENKGRTFIARCGDREHPCELRIELFGGEYSPVIDMLEGYERTIEFTKEEIIKTKLDVLFQYLSEEEGVDYFKDHLDFYTKEKVHLTALKKEYDDLYFNAEREEKLLEKTRKIAKIQERVQEFMRKYQENNNPETLKDAMTIYIHELMPEIQNKETLKYETREFIYLEDVKKYELFQRGWRPNKVEYTFGEFPRVL